MRCHYIMNKVSVSNEVKVTFDEYADVLVAGLGTAGAIAAIVAAEEGLRVIGVERTSGMGGIGTMGCVWDYYYGSPGGRFEAINRECEAMLEEGYVGSDIDHEDRCIPGTVKMQVLEQSAQRSGCRIWYETVVTGLYMEGKKVIGVRCLHKGETRNIGTGMVIDCTGEDAICRMAGCLLRKGRQWDGGGPVLSKTIGIFKDGYVRGVWSISGKVDVFNANTLSDKIITAASQPFYLKDFYDEKDRMVCEGTILGVRETYNIESEENLSFADVANGRKTEHPIFYAFAPLDNFERDIAFESDVHQDWHLISDMHSYGFSAGIPMGSLIPKGFDGLLVAGRGIGIDHDLESGVRMKKDMEKCGEAAASLACLAIRKNIQAFEVPYSSLAEALKASSCLNTDDDVGIASFKQKVGKRWKSVPLLTKIEDLRNALASEDPCLAIWSIRYGMTGIQVQPELLKYLELWRQSDNFRLARNSAIAVGILGDDRVCVQLRAMIEERPVIPAGKYLRHTDVSKAICLLGRLHDASSVDILLHIIEDYADSISDKSELSFFMCTREDYIYEFLSLSIAALMRISDCYPELETKISERLVKWAMNPDFSLVISMGQCEVGRELQRKVLDKFTGRRK